MAIVQTHSSGEAARKKSFYRDGWSGQEKTAANAAVILNVLGYIVTTRIRREDHAIKTEQ
jgi:hypothetical protein